MTIPATETSTSEPHPDSATMVEKTPQIFHCSACGECCSSWNLLIENHKAEVLLERAWVQDRLNETGTTMDPATEHTHLLPQTLDSICVFLEPDGKCAIHRHEGLELKPNECQRFPFASLEWPAQCSNTDQCTSPTTLYDTSAACKRVAEELLTTFRPIIPDGQDPLPPGIDGEGPDMPARIPLRHGFRPPTVGMETYDTLLHGYFQCFSNPNHPPAVALAMAHNWRKSVTASSAALPPDSPTLDATTSFLPEFLQAFQTQGDRWVPYFCLRAPYGTYSHLDRLLNGEYRDIKVFGPSRCFNLKKVRHMPLDESHCGEYVKGFLYTILQRRKLLSFGHSAETLLGVTTLAYFLWRWHCRALMEILDSPLTPDIATRAIRLVERYYTGHQPRFLEGVRTGWGMRLLIHHLWRQLPPPTVQQSTPRP